MLGIRPELTIVISSGWLRAVAKGDLTATPVRQLDSVFERSTYDSVHSSKIKHPKLQMSDFVSYRFSCRISGGMYNGVCSSCISICLQRFVGKISRPVRTPTYVCVNICPPRFLLKPKSPNLSISCFSLRKTGRESSERLNVITNSYRSLFSGFKSRCNTCPAPSADEILLFNVISPNPYVSASEFGAESLASFSRSSGQ